MTNWKQIDVDLRKSFANVGEIPAGYARLGIGDGSGVIVASFADRLVHLYRDNMPSFKARVPSRMNILNLNNARLEGTLVRIGTHPEKPEVLHILGIDSGEGNAGLGGLTIDEQKSRADETPSTANILDFRLEATGTFEITIQPGWYIKPSTANQKWYGGDTIDLTSLHSALTAGQHQFVAIAFDCEADDVDRLVSVYTSAVTGSNRGDYDQNTFDGLDFTPIQASLGAVHLEYNQTGLTEVDIYRNIDPRFALRPIGTIAKISTANTANPPTDAELDSAFGQPASVGAGFIGILNDNGAGTNEYLCWSDGTNWFYATGTKAT